MSLAPIIVLAAATVAPSSPSRIVVATVLIVIVVVATVLSQPIYADQLGERSAGDGDVEWARAERLASRIVPPLKARLCAEQGCNPTEAEMRAMREPIEGATPNRLNRRAFDEKRAVLTRELAAPGISAEHRKEIAQQLHELRRSLRPLSGGKVAREAARYMVESWKFNKALHDRYGGEVIWQPMGLNAVGAFRSWLEEQEAAGAFRIIPPDLRASFWQSVSSDRGRPVDDPHPFAEAKAPWASARGAATLAPSPPAHTVVATVLSQPIYADQVWERQAADDEVLERARGERLASLIVPPLKARFCAEHGCNPIEEELRIARELIQRASPNRPDRQVFDEKHAALTRELAATGVTAERQKEIAGELREVDRVLRLLSSDEPLREAARGMVEMEV